MARTLIPLLILSALAGCRSTASDRDTGSAPRGFDRPRDLRGALDPDEPNISAEERQRRGRAKYAVSDIDRDPAERSRNYADRYGPTAR